MNAKILAAYQGTAILSSTFTMSDYKLEGSQHLYPVSLDDPARQYVVPCIIQISSYCILASDKDSAAKNGLTQEDVVAIQRCRLPISLQSQTHGCIPWFLDGYWTG